MRKLIFFLLFINIQLFAQTKQANTVGSEIIADAPCQILKYDNQGNMNGIPVFVYIHDSNNFTNKNDLIDISISLKNASNTIFDSPLTFDNYSDSAFQNLIGCKSINDNYFDIQAFDSSNAVKDSLTTINFTKDTNWWIPPVTLVSITQTHWYFMFLIPAEKLAGYDDIIDLKVDFNLDYETDQYKYLRVFRYADSIPKMQDWYRGDTHFHGFMTQNNAEIGFPYEASRVVAKISGLDWITVTDHSCDYDNYGTSMYLNWQKLGEQIEFLNAEDFDFVYIRGIEMSVDNSAGDVVHALVYPPVDDPFNLTYLGDGGGDLLGTDITVDDVLSSLSQSNGFAYAAHPFSEGDKLSSLVGGNVWNLSDSKFPANDALAPSVGNVICNDTNQLSDIFSTDTTLLFKSNLIGGQIWNMRNSVQTTDEAYDPWNANYSSTVPFAPLDSLDPLFCYNRYRQNRDVINFLWKKSLRLKNHNNSLGNWKFYISAGSDAHGSFNYSNTDLTLEITGNINNNAIGKLSTLAYCPNGMGINGTNILQAFKNGNTVLSDGPICTMKITLESDEIIIGEDSILSIAETQQAMLSLQMITTSIYGDISYLKLIGYTQDSIYNLELPINNNDFALNLSDVLTDLFGNTPENEYFMLTTEMETVKDYGALANLYKIPLERFHCYTNPIYLKINNPVSIENVDLTSKINVFPNPCSENFSIEISDNQVKIEEIIVYDLLMHKIQNIHFSKTESNKIAIQLPDNNFKSGIYFIEVKTDKKRYLSRIIKQ